MKNNQIGFVKTASSLIVNCNGKTHTFHKESPYFKDVVSALKEKRYDEIPDLIDLAKKIKVYSEGNFKCSSENDVTVDGKPVAGLIAKRIFEFMSEGLPYEPLLKFIRRVRKNPSYSAQTRLYECLEHNHHPILEDGRFLAYKAVRGDFKDKYKGRFDNSPGKIVEMPREEVDDNHNQTCSAGLHVSSFEYAKDFMSRGDKLIDCAICPSEVVAIPYDYNNQKMRTCKYEVLQESEGYELKNQLIGEDYDPCDQDYNEDCCSFCDDYESDCDCRWCESCDEHEDYCYCEED